MFYAFCIFRYCFILAYKKQIIVVNEDEIVFSYLVKKTQHIKYNDIRCILMIPLNGRTDVILIDKMYNRLVTLEQVYVNYDILYDTLIKHEIDLVDFGELVEQNKDVSKYVPALNWIEKNFYKSICNENTTIKNMSKTIEKEKRKKTKQFLKALGWILIIADAVAFFIGGKTMLVIFIMVLMITYAVYIKYYPYIFIEVTTKKGQELAYQLPFMGAAIAMLLSLNTSKLFNYEFGNYMKITAIITALLALPFIIKSLKTDVPQKFGRKLSVVFAAFIIAFTISFPINFLFTFDGATHEIAIVTDSNSGITQDEGRKLGISVLPMPFYINDVMYLEGITLSQEDFYERLKNDESISTSQPSPAEVCGLWDNLLEEYDEIVHIPMSSGLSASCDTATMLARDYDGRVQVVNNQRISVTQRQSVLDAIALRDAGKNATEIKEKLEEEKMESSIYITLETLKYLKKGGRITPAAAAIGTVLNLKPVLQIQGEKLDAYAKVRGKKQAKRVMMKAMQEDWDTRFKKYVESGEMCLQMAYAGNKEEAEEFKKEVQAAFPGIDIHMDPLSLSVACHIGHGALAVACAKKVTV